MLVSKKRKFISTALSVIIISSAVLGYLEYSVNILEITNTSLTPTPTAMPTPTFRRPQLQPYSFTQCFSNNHGHSIGEINSNTVLHTHPDHLPRHQSPTVFIASSLTNVIANMTSTFRHCNTTADIIVNPVSSSSLYTANHFRLTHATSHVSRHQWTTH